MENTAKIHIIGAAAVLVSGIKLEDWKLAEKYAPEALTVLDEKGEPVFRVATGDGAGSMNRYGVVWGCENYRSGEGNATVTILFDHDVENREEAVMNVIGNGLVNLTEIEQAMSGILETVREKQQQTESRLHRM